MIKTYLAGPDVFHPEAVKLGQLKRDICARYGLDGLFPLDNELNIQGMAHREASFAIYSANVAMVQRADCVIANLTPFRGASADAGTIWELGFACGMGLPCFGYSMTRNGYADRARAHKDRMGADDTIIENFGLTENLMIYWPVEPNGLVLGDSDDPFPPLDGPLDADLAIFEACVSLAAERLAGSGPAQARG
ncbi:MAG: nucleoside 2-deoxyribosyltransferase [Maricaulaceae bacterium]